MTMQTLALENSLLRCGIEAARIGMCVFGQSIPFRRRRQNHELSMNV